MINNEILLPYMDSGKKMEKDNWVRVTFGNWYLKKSYLSIIMIFLILTILCICLFMIVLRQDSRIIYISLVFALLYGSFVSFIMGTCRKEVSIDFFNEEFYITYKKITLYGAYSLKYEYKFPDVEIFLNTNRMYIEGEGEQNIIFISPEYTKKEEITTKCNISHEIFLTGYMYDSVKKILEAL